MEHKAGAEEGAGTVFLNQSFYSRSVKRALDVLLSAVGLVAAAPLLAVIGVTVYATMGRPVLFVQERTGLGGRIFGLMKFRTMRDATDSGGRPLPDERRTTPVGRFLRSTSLDELPELVNVVAGDMSLVGPRPLLPRYTPFFTERERRRLDVRPGITGLAQVKGRNAVSWDERLELDVQYVEQLRPGLDARILASTAAVVLTRKGFIAHPATAMRDLDVERQEASGRR